MRLTSTEDSRRSRFTNQLLESLDAARDDGSIDALSNVELLLILNAAGDALTRTEIRSLARDRLLAQQSAVCSAAPRPTLSKSDYEKLVDSFLAVLMAYAVSEELGAAIASAVTLERQAHLKRRFLRRMAEAADVGGISSTELAIPAELGKRGDMSSEATVSKGPAVLATVLAFAFCQWLYLEDAYAQETSTPSSIDHLSSLPSPDPAAGQAGVTPAGHSDDEANSQLQALLQSLDSEDAKTRAITLDHLSSMRAAAQSALPVLRKRLKLQDKILRWEAVWVIGYISKGAAEDLDALTTALLDPDERVSKTAALALGLIGPAAKKALPALAHSHLSNASLASACIKNASEDACAQVQQQMKQKNPLLQFIFEQHLDFDHSPRGVCMCSFMAFR